jgi:Flp pilus assembly pilin Flp
VAGDAAVTVEHHRRDARADMLRLMLLPGKALTPRPPTSARSPLLDPDRAPSAMDHGPADVVRARALVGNAAVTAAMGGLPAGGRGTEPAGWTGQMLLAGQNLIGNQAVANQAVANRVVANQAGALPAPAAPPLEVLPGTKPPARQPVQPKATPPPAPKPDQKDPGTAPAERPDKGAAKKEEAAGARSPGADPKFQALKKDVNVKKRVVGTSHPPATVEAGAAQAASVPPADDQEARGKASHAEDMEAAQPKEFTKAEFVKAVEDAIAKRAPKNLDEADKFGDSGKAEEVKAEVQGKVGEGKEASAKEIADTTAQAPQPAPDTKEVVPMAPDKLPGRPGAPNPNQAAPDALPPSATDMSEGPAQVNQQMAGAQVTEQQLSLKNSREPAFDKAVRDKKTMEAHSATAPRKLRAGESRELKKAKNTAAGQGSAAMAGMHATRVSTGQQVGAGKTGAKSRDEDKRTHVTALLQKVFDQTKCDVEKILSDLDRKVDRQFTKDEKRARDGFTKEHTDGMNRYKDERYSGVIGKANWVRDLFADLPEEANRIYERAKKNYLTAMRQVISDIADTIERELRRAKDRIAAGRTELTAAVDKLPADLKAIGREAATEFEGQFEELKGTVDDKGTELVDTLATRYTDAVKAVDEEIAAEKEKNKGLVSKAVDAIGDVIRTIKELGSLLMGVLRKAVSAIGLILRDPIGFLGNLVTGVGGGLKLFMRNAGRHLGQGVLAWLLGTGGTAGMQMPRSFDILGILLMLATMLGLAWPKIRARLVRKVPNRAVIAAELAIPLLAATKRRGVAGMWPDLRPRVGDLRKDLVSNLVSYILPTVIIAGITFIASMFNPASAFIRAVKMIIDIVRFIVTNARMIIEFVNAVLDAVIAIAKGNTGSAPALVERALARSIPVLIGALAAIIGIGGLGGKVKQIFQKLGRTVDRAIDWVIDKIAGLVKRLWAKIKPKRAKHRRPKDRDRPGVRPLGRPLRPLRDRRRPTRRPDRRGPDQRRRPDQRRPDRRESPLARRRELKAALREAANLAKRTGDEEAVQRGLPQIRARHRLTVLTMSIRPATGAKDLYVFHGAINPRASFDQLAINTYLRNAMSAYEKKNRAFAITDMPGKEVGEIVPGLTKVLRLSEPQARRYAEKWVKQNRLTRTPTSRGRVVYSFRHLTDVHLEVPFDHPERGRWLKGAERINMSETRANRLWYLIIAGIRDNRPDYFEVVANAMLGELRIPPKKGALWSKGVDLSDYAVSLGFTTLEAQEFYQVTEGLVFLDGMVPSRGVWKAFSALYAGKLRKEVHIFLRQWNPGSVMVRVELKAIRDTERRLRETIDLKFRGMAWGDDPNRYLVEPVPKYWRELDPGGNELNEGQQQILDESEAKRATKKAKQRFERAQFKKKRERKKGRK